VAPTGTQTGSSAGGPTLADQSGPPAGGSVPAGFEPASVTFVSTETGFVLGEAGGSASLVRTSDDGASWVSLQGPPAAYVTPFDARQSSAAQVSEVRFADPMDGWAYGPSLFATHDGARTWQQVNLGGTVVSLETMGGVVDAVVSPCGAGATCTGPLRLEQAPVSGGPFETVLVGPSVQNAGVDAQDLSLHAPVGFVLLGFTGSDGSYRPAFYATGNLADPHGWNAFPDPCAVTKGGLASFVAPNTTTLYSLCGGDAAMGSSEKYAVVTTGGRSTLVGDAPYPGDGGTLAATPSGDLVLATASGASWLDRSVTGGASWSTAAFYGDGGFGFYDLGFTTDTQGVVVHGLPIPAEAPNTPSLLMTHDGGASWQVVPIG
jgi:hypothetical protein